MTEVYTALRAVVKEWGEANGYAAASDPFSFDAEPHAGGKAFYIDPPRLRVEGYVGGSQSVTGTFAIWASREAAGADAGAEAGRLAVDLAALAGALMGAELGDDVNVHDAFEIDVQPRESDAVTVVGRLALTVDWDERP